MSRRIILVVSLIFYSYIPMLWASDEGAKSLEGEIYFTLGANMKKMHKEQKEKTNVEVLEASFGRTSQATKSNQILTVTLQQLDERIKGIEGEIESYKEIRRGFRKHERSLNFYFNQGIPVSYKEFHLVDKDIARVTYQLRTSEEKLIILNELYAKADEKVRSSITQENLKEYSKKNDPHIFQNAKKGTIDECLQKLLP